jgi:tellurite resistance protein
MNAAGMVHMQVDLTQFGAERLKAAVAAAIQGASVSGETLPTMDRLEQGVRATLSDPYEARATYFQSILEIAYLVASADGFASEERHALSEVLVRVFGHAIGSDVLELHFRDLDDACEMLGRRERLRRAAEDFVDGAYRREVLGFATIVAVADGTLADAEAEALMQVGGYMGFESAQVEQVVSDVVRALRTVLEGADGAGA